MSYKLTFECTNNVAEYEALLLGLNALKVMGAKRVQVMGDSELVINQVNDSYQTNILGWGLIEMKYGTCLITIFRAYN